MAKQPQSEPDGDPDVGDGISHIRESPREQPHGDPDVRDGLTSLTGGGGKEPDGQERNQHTDEHD